MPAKEKKTQDDLIALLMWELRKHPECDSVVRVTITLPVRDLPASVFAVAADVFNANWAPPASATRSGASANSGSLLSARGGAVLAGHAGARQPDGARRAAIRTARSRGRPAAR